MPVGAKAIASGFLQGGPRTRLEEVLDREQNLAWSDKLVKIWAASPDLQQCCISALIKEIRCLVEGDEESPAQVEALTRLEEWQECNEDAEVRGQLTSMCLIGD